MKLRQPRWSVAWVCSRRGSAMPAVVSAAATDSTMAVRKRLP